LEGGPLLSEWWKKASKDFVPYLNIEARTPAVPDQGMYKEKGGRGFPYCTIMNAAGEVIWEVRPTSEAVVAKGFANANMLVKLQAALSQKPDDQALEASASLLEGIGRSQRKAPAMSDMEEWGNVKGVDKVVVTAFNAWKKGQEIRGAMRRRGGAYKLMKEGTQPEKGSVYALGFFMNATRDAIAAKDAKIAAAALKRLQPEWKAYLKKNPSFAKNPRSKRTFDMIEGYADQVKDLQKKAGEDKSADKSGVDK